MIFTKKYNENFDLVFISQEGVSKNFVKVIKTSDDIGTFKPEDGEFQGSLNGLLDGELQIAVDPSSTVSDNLNNIYFEVAQEQNN